MKTELTIISDDLNHGIIDEKKARTLLLDLLSVSNDAEYTRGYRDGWRDCCKDVKEFG